MLYLIIYISIGFGFALSSWLQAQENNVKNKQEVRLDLNKWVVFILLWWLIAIYCYRSEVSRTIPTLSVLIEYYKNKHEK